MSTLGYDLTAHVTRFCRALRDYGLLAGPAESADALRAISLVGLMDPGRVYWALRSILVSHREEIPVFDQLFQRFWDFDPPPVRNRQGPGDSRFGGLRELRPTPDAVLEPLRRAGSDRPLVQALRTGASPMEVTGHKVPAALGAEELSELSRIAARVVRALATRPGRRLRRHRRKGAPDLRGAMRLNLATGGDLIRLPRRRRVPRVPRMVMLLDVSGSMDHHSRLLLHLAYSVSQHTSHAETFVFSTSVTRITPQLRAPSFAEALRHVNRAVDHWSSGTRIGHSLARLSADYGGLMTRYTAVFLLSDGWDTGEPDRLAREIRRIRKRVRRFVWLNPLQGTPGYEPLTRGLLAARPFVDQFASARDVAQLKKLPHLLRA